MHRPERRHVWWLVTSASLLVAALSIPGQAQNAAQSASVGRELESILTFETPHNGTMPSGWGGGPAGTMAVDSETVHGGRWSECEVIEPYCESARDGFFLETVAHGVRSLFGDRWRRSL